MDSILRGRKPGGFEGFSNHHIGVQRSAGPVILVQFEACIRRLCGGGADCCNDFDLARECSIGRTAPCLPWCTPCLDDNACQTPELRDVLRRGDAHIQEEWAWGATSSVCLPRGERHAVRHAADGESLDHCVAIRTMPNAAQMACAILHVRGTSREPVYVEP